MPSKSVTFHNVGFAPEMYYEALADVKAEAILGAKEFDRRGSGNLKTDAEYEAQVDTYGISPRYLKISGDEGTWELDTVDEFIQEIYSPHSSSVFSIGADSLYGPMELRIAANEDSITITVTHRDRPIILRELAKWKERAASNRRPAAPPIVFLGHGGSPQWRELEGYVTQLGYVVEAFETLPRAGYTIKEVLDEMMQKSDIAILLMTAEDEQGDGTVRARQNVVHETGLFQGHLGFKRTIVVLEEGTTDFSNIAGLQEIRYASGNIRETFGDVASTLLREFPRS